jgi:hypothetical protein
MKQTLSLDEFRHSFMNIRPTNFSWEGLEILFDWFEDLEQSMEHEIEFDPIAFCCDYSEASVREIIDGFAIDLEGLEPDEVDEFVLDYLNDRTIVLGVCTHGEIVFQNF